MRNLQNLVAELNAKNIAVEFVKENLSLSGDESPMSRLMLSILGGVAAFEIGVAEGKGLTVGASTH